MNKRGFLFILSIFGILFLFFKYGFAIKEKIFSIPYHIRGFYLDSKQGIEDSINQHFNQVETIKLLTKKLEESRKTALLANHYKKMLQTLKEAQNLKMHSTRLELIQAKSYLKFSDYDKVWIDFKNFDKTKIYGLIKNNLTAGIVVSKNGKPLALLQGDSKCTFSVVIGDMQAPGIAFGAKDKIIVKFIPPWIVLKEGDEVTTSGLDNIFMLGIKVGKVTKIIKKLSFQEVYIKPYYNSTKIPSYFHIIDKKIIE